MSRTSFTGGSPLPRGGVRTRRRRLLRCPRSTGRRRPGSNSPALSKAPAEDDVVAGEVNCQAQGRRGRVGRSVASRHGLGKGPSGNGKAFEILLAGKGNERAMAARPRPIPTSRCGTELHPPHRRDRLATLGIPQPGRVEHAVLPGPERAHRIHPRQLRVGAGRRRGCHRRHRVWRWPRRRGIHRHGGRLRPPGIHRATDQRPRLYRRRRESADTLQGHGTTPPHRQPRYV